MTEDERWKLVGMKAIMRGWWTREGVEARRNEYSIEHAETLVEDWIAKNLPPFPSRQRRDQ